MTEIHEKTEKVRQIIRSKPYLAWSTRNIEALSLEAMVEAVLTKGDFDDFRAVVNILGVEAVREIFTRQVSRPRKNYSRKTEHFFRLLFERVSGDS